MSDYTTLGVLTILFTIYLLTFRKDFKNWYEIESTQKSFIIRGIVTGVAIIILMLCKIINSKM